MLTRVLTFLFLAVLLLLSCTDKNSILEPVSDLVSPTSEKAHGVTLDQVPPIADFDWSCTPGTAECPIAGIPNEDSERGHR